jgi:hypothetical protein
MANLSQAQIAMYAQSAGMPNPQLMAAIAMAESGGNPRAHNPIPPDDSYGLWQINMLGAMGPSRRAQYGITSNAQLFDPAVNARAAAKILSSQGPQAWSTYSSGAYKKYLGAVGSGGGSGATAASWWDPLYNLDPFGLVPGNPSGASPGDPFGGNPPYSGTVDVATGVAGVAEAIQKAAVWMADPKHWVRVGYVLGGAVLAVMGLAIVAKPLVQQATPLGQAAKKLIPSGKASA